MIGGLKQTTSRLAIAAATGLFMGGIALTPVQAADLGGDCCADLEERVAELEATTVRKGNRKVSVKLSGWVNRALLWWDDDHEDDVLIVDGENSNTRFRITGSATISPGRTAGFRLENELNIRDNSSSVSNCDPSTISGNHCMAVPAVNNGNDARYQDVWIKDASRGKITLGHGDTASNGTSEVDLSGTSIAQYAGMADIGGSFVFRTSTGGYASFRLKDVYNQHDGLSRNSRIRYDTPSISGFTFSTSYGQDDIVDGALRFKKEWNSVRCAWAGAIAHDTTAKNEEHFGVRVGADRWTYNTSGSCIHTPSGLNLTLGYAETDEGNTDVDQKWSFVKVGISRRWNSHGKTSIAAQYARNEDRNSGVSATGVVTRLNDDLDSWGVSFVQNIDSAALELYAAYSNHSYDDNTAVSYDDLQFVLMGARIKF